MSSIFSNIPEDSNITLRICDERWSMPFSAYLDGLESSSTAFKEFSIHSLYDIPTANNLISTGYQITDPFVMDGFTTENETDPKTEEIRRGFVNFKNRLNKSYAQTRDEFIANPQFFNFQNFIIENKFSISYIEKLIDTKNNVVYRSDKLKESANKVLMDTTLFGSTPSNFGEVRLMWQNLYFYPYDNDITEKEGLQYLTNFFVSTNLELRDRDGNPYFDPKTVITSEGIEYYNNNASTRQFLVSVRRHLKLPVSDSVSNPIVGWRNGMLLVATNPNAPQDVTPFVNLSPEKIFVDKLTSPPLSLTTYKRLKISHRTMLSRSRFNRSPEVGYSLGGATELQPRTPLCNSISTESCVNYSSSDKISTPIGYGNINLIDIGRSTSEFIAAT